MDRYIYIMRLYILLNKNLKFKEKVEFENMVLREEIFFKNF